MQTTAHNPYCDERDGNQAGRKGQTPCHPRHIATDYFHRIFPFERANYSSPSDPSFSTHISQGGASWNSRKPWITAWSTTKSTHKRNTRITYQFLLPRFAATFRDRQLTSISSDEILFFLTLISNGNKQATKRCRYAALNAFFNLIRNSCLPDFKNPCDTLLLRKLFRPARDTRWDILEKETVDEIIFKTPKIRNRILVELMARGGLRVSEALRLRGKDVEDQKLVLRSPNSGKEQKVVFIPQKVALRLKEYIREKEIDPEERIFPMGYSAARIVVRQAGKRVGMTVRPHDLRRHTRPRMPRDPALRLRSSPRSFCAMRTCLRPRGIWAR